MGDKEVYKNETYFQTVIGYHKNEKNKKHICTSWSNSFSSVCFCEAMLSNIH